MNGFYLFFGKNHTLMLITFDQKEYEKLDDNSYRLEKRRLKIELLKLKENVPLIRNVKPSE